MTTLAPKTVLALEQALTLPYATQRFVHLDRKTLFGDDGPER